MARIYATGMGPLPQEKPKLIHGSCSRTWQFVRPMLEAGHEVCLAAARITDWNAPENLPPVHKTEEKNFTYILADELKKFNDPAFHQSLIDQFKPDALIAITTPACRPLVETNCDAPLWADIHGYVMGEAQIVAEQLESNHYVYEFWKRYEEAIFRAACFSTTSNVQRHVMIGELGAMGRLNRDTAGYEFVYSIPLARPTEEIKQTATLLRGKVVPSDAFILLWLGGYNYWADPDTLFHGVEKAMGQNPRIHFVSTGGKIDGTNEVTFPRLLALVEKSAHKERFHFQGWVEADAIPNYLSEADAGINIDKVCYEAVYGARHRIVEMLRAGLPVITTRITEISRDVERCAAGMASPPEDTDALADNIVEAANRPGKLMEMGILGQELFLERYTDEVTVKPLLEWLQNPTHAPDWGKEGPRREHLYEHRFNRRPLVDKLKAHLKARRSS